MIAYIAILPITKYIEAIRVSDRVYERIAGVKEDNDHLTMDGALREMIGDFTVREETAERKHAFEDFAHAIYDDLNDAIHAILLYGSTARGEANRSSDVDVLVVLTDGEIFWPDVEGDDT